MKYKAPYRSRSLVKEMLDDEIKESTSQKKTDFLRGYIMGLGFARVLLKSPGKKDKV